MDILSSITAVLSTLKSGFEIKKLAGNLDSEVQQGELRVEIRKLQESLIDVQDVLLKAKKEILDNREIIQEKDAEIEELKKAVNFKPLLTRKDGCYFDESELEKGFFDPFCSHCWDVNNLPVHLTKQNSVLLSGEKGIRLLYYYCPNCKNSYQMTKRLS